MICARASLVRLSSTKVSNDRPAIPRATHAVLPLHPLNNMSVIALPCCLVAKTSVSTNPRQPFGRVNSIGFLFLFRGPDHATYVVGLSLCLGRHPVEHVQAVLLLVSEHDNSNTNATIADCVVRQAAGQRFVCPRECPFNVGIDCRAKYDPSML